MATLDSGIPLAVTRWLPRAALLALVWWLLTAGDASSWVLGAPLIAGIAAWQVASRPASGVRVRLLGVARFVPFFLWRSLVGGYDVAWRSMHPALPIEPELRDYRLRLPDEGPARVLFVSVINLLPGTVTAAFHRDRLEVHVLTAGPRALAVVEQLERRVADVFGHELHVSAGDEGT